ncbi:MULTISPECIES: hypothetical protein [Paenibacillus]|uniref:hypothetical protein n=1 Tax=Paenibacillus TaxID=44249 RepID=UPI002FE37FA7
MQVLRQHKKLAVSLLLAFAGVAVLVVLWIFKPWGAGSALESPVVFVRDDLLMMMQEDEQQPLELGGPLPEDELRPWPHSSVERYMKDRLIKVNERRSRMFFVREITKDGKAVLSYRDLSKSSSASEPGSDLASGISEMNSSFFEISGDGEFAFYLKDDDRGALYVHNLDKETLIDERIVIYNYIDEPGLLYYITLDDQNQRTLKMAKRRGFHKQAVIDTNVSRISNIDTKSGEIHYLKKTSNRSNDLYSMMPGKSPVKLISNVDYEVGEVHEGALFYRATEPTNLTLYDVVVDDLKESDAAIIKPKEEDYASVEKRTLTNYWTGEPYEADVEVFDESGFDKAEEAYDKKVERDRLRSVLKTRSLGTFGSLHYFSGGQSVDVTDRYERMLLVDAKTGLIIYKKLPDYTKAPKIPLSEVEFPEQAEADYKKKLDEASEVYLYTPRTGAVKLDKDSGSLLIQAALSPDGKKLYGNEEGKTFVSYDLEEGLPVHRKVLDEDVSLFLPLGENRDKLFYFKISGEESTLYAYANGASHQIFKGVDYSSNKYYSQTDELYYLADYDLEERAGTLYRYRNGKSVKISEHVHAFDYNESSGLYYIINFDPSKGTGDLMREKNGKPEQVADRVRFMLGVADYEIL